MLKPLRDNVLLKPHKKEEKLESGLYVPGTSEGRYVKATVLAVGPGKPGYDRWLDVGVKVGDVVLYDSDYVLDLPDKEDGVVLQLCPESGLLAVE